MVARDIITIAGSAGAVQELRTLVAALPSDFEGTLFIVIHTSAGGPGLLAHILNQAGKLSVSKPRHGERIRRGHVYVAPPDHHLLIADGTITLGKGPRENGFRPAADPLFRSAARAYGQRVVGVVLSGGMDDGSLGLQAIKQHGGVAIVQDPDEAMYPSMPESAMRNVEVDHVLRVSEMPQALVQLSANGRHLGGNRMKHAKNQSGDSAVVADMSTANHLKGPPSAFICPECGGSLWELEQGNMLHYRCHVGHAYTAESLVAGQDGAVEEALWTALRTLEETAALRRRLADDARSKQLSHVAVGYEERAQQFQQRAGLIRKVLLNDNLPKNLKGYGSSKPAKRITRQVEKSTANKRRKKQS